MKKAKKGWLKIFEASISITLIMGFIVLVYAQNIQRPSQSESLLRWEESVLDEVKSDPVLRDAVINTPDIVCDPEQGGGIYDYVRDKIIKNFPGFGFSCRVCDIDEACGPIDPPDYRPEIYSEERIISSTLTKFAPKKLKIFVWPLEPEEQEPEDVPDACSPNYLEDCDDWSACVNGKETRLCRDSACNEPARTDTRDCEVAPPEELVITDLGCKGSGSPQQLPIVCNWVNPTTTFKYSVSFAVDGTVLQTWPGNENVASYSIPQGNTGEGSHSINVKVSDVEGAEVTDKGQTKTCTVTLMAGQLYTSC